MVVVTRVKENENKKRLKPDEDLRRAITIDEMNVIYYQMKKEIKNNR